MARTKKRFNAIGRDRKSDENTGGTLQDQEAASTWRTGLYARISADSDPDRKNSIESQLQILYTWFDGRKEFQIVREYVDRGFSGTSFHRPAFEEMMDDIRSGKINCIATKDLSRLGRDYLETSNYVETIFPFLGVRYISVNDHFDTSEEQNGNKDLEIALKNLVNDMYARDISKRQVSVQRQNQLRGRFVGSNAPYGYKVNENHPLRQLIVDEPAAEVVRSIYEMALEGMTLRAISRALQEQRLRIPGSYLKTGKLYLQEGEEAQKWYIGTISGILSSEAYIGNLVQGKRKTRLYRGEAQHFTEKEEWIITEDAHEPIISRETYDAVRAILDKRSDESCFQRIRTADVPIKPDKYAGILFCGICGQKMRYASRVTKAAPLQRIYYYRCDNTYLLGKEGRCSTTIMEAALDSLVKQLTGDAVRNFSGGTGRVMEISEKQLQEALRKKEREIRKNRRMLENLEAESEASYEAYVLGEISKKTYMEKTSAFEAERQKLREVLHELEEKKDEFIAGIRHKAEWMLALESASDGELDRELLRLLLKRIEIHQGHRIEVTWPFFETDVFTGRKEGQKDD